VNIRLTKCTSSMIKVENIQFYTKREGPTSKATSPLLDTSCQGQHPFALSLPKSIPKLTCIYVCTRDPLTSRTRRNFQEKVISWLLPSSPSQVHRFDFHAGRSPTRSPDSSHNMEFHQVKSTFSLESSGRTANNMETNPKLTTARTLLQTQ